MPFDYALVKTLKVKLIANSQLNDLKSDWPQGFNTNPDRCLFFCGISDRKHCEIVLLRLWNDKQECNHYILGDFIKKCSLPLKR